MYEAFLFCVYDAEHEVSGRTDRFHVLVYWVEIDRKQVHVLRIVR